MRDDFGTGSLVARVVGRQVVATRAQYAREACDTRWHAHDRLHLSFVFAGGGQSVSHGTQAAKRQSVWCYPAGVQHRWLPETEWASSLNLDVAGELLDELGMSEGEVLERVMNHAELKTQLTSIACEVGLGDLDSSDSIASLLVELLAASAATTSSDRPAWVNQVEQCLNDRWSESIELDELAQLAGVHRITISKSFRKHFGMTLGDYRRRLKIERSMSRVTGTGEGLTQIALDCGFSDQSHFTRVFHSQVGAAPGQVRQRLG